MESKIGHKRTYLRNRNRLKDIENGLWFSGGGGGGGMEWEVWVSRCELLYIGRINNKVLQYSTENYIQYPMISHNGRDYTKKRMHIYV